MVKKSAVSGEYLIQIEDSGKVVVYQWFENVKGGLREAADAVGYTYDASWTTRQFGSKLCKEYGDGKCATVGNYVIRVKPDGGIEIYRMFENTKAVLREIAETLSFDIDPSWTTGQLGNKLVNVINK